MGKDSNAAVEAARKSLAMKAMDFQLAFSTPEGEKVLKILKAQFCPAELFDPNSDSKTFVNIGERNVVTYIEQMMRVNDNDNQ